MNEGVAVSSHARIHAVTVRLDVWLDVACLFRTRSEAQRECKVGRISVNGVVAKPHRDVRVGDELVIARPWGRKQTVVVRGVTDKHLPKADARELYEDRTPPPTPAEIEARRVERLFRATHKLPARLDRRSQRSVAKRKWTT
jgi:ribosome-associated heat shock protein Hsp15